VLEALNELINHAAEGLDVTSFANLRVLLPGDPA
jgi:hypothetical protein